ncbi:7150_t:CDS:2, partial [Scutellospora calospora]
MAEFIPINLINLNLSQEHFKENNESNNEIIEDLNIIQEVTSSIGKATYRSIKDILLYIIPSLLKKGIINHSNSVLHIRISGDGRNVGHKVKHVMVTFTLLNDLANLYNPNYHFTLLLYPGIEQYTILEIALAPLIADLNDLVNGLVDKQGHKAANSDHFCLWCLIHKNQNGLLNYDWNISKNIDDIYYNYSNIPGHQHSPLFYMIPLTHWVVDELHIMLRITDRLWLLLMIKIQAKTSMKIRIAISQEMKCIN